MKALARSDDGMLHATAREVVPLDQIVPEIMRGEFSSNSGMGIGIVGTRNLMDDFNIDTTPGKGTVITARKYLR